MHPRRSDLGNAGDHLDGREHGHEAQAPKARNHHK